MPIREVPEVARRALAGVQLLELYDGEGRLTKTVVQMLRFASEVPALLVLFRQHLDKRDSEGGQFDLEDMRLQLEMREEWIALNEEYDQPSTRN